MTRGDDKTWKTREMRESTRFFAKIVPSLRASTAEILECQHMQAQRIDVPVCGGVTCWWHAAQDGTACVSTHESIAVSKDASAIAGGVSDRCFPVVFELHGGGFVLGDARKDDAFCAALCGGVRAHVVGIDYPKAPEQAYPAAAEAVWAVLEWFAQNAASYGMDAHRFAVLGFSSGGNLAAVTALRAAECPSASFSLVAQVLQYPFLDAATPPAQKKPQPWDLSAEVMDAFTELYCAGADAKDARISPVYAFQEQLRGVVPALIVTAGRDALQSEGEQYAQLLQKAGVTVEYVPQPHAHHGYVEDWFNPACYEATPEDTRALHEAQFGSSAQQALDDSVRFLRKCFTENGR